MTDLYIATKTQADYDALMRLAEAAGYTWRDGILPTANDYWRANEENTAIRLCNHGLLYGPRDRYKKDGHTIEMIPNLANIVAIYTTKKLDWENYVKSKSISIPEGIYQSCVFELNDGNVWGSNRNYCKALAVEYKPKESEEVMPEKVKFSKEVYDALKEYGLPDDGTELWPFGALDSLYDYWKEHGRGTLGSFIDGGIANQWKLIDALRYGYEAEPEQLYYVWFVKGDLEAFLNLRKSNNGLLTTDKNETLGYKTQFTMPEIEAINPCYKAFAVPVEEVDSRD